MVKGGKIVIFCHFSPHTGTKGKQGILVNPDLYRGAISGFWGLKTHVHGRWSFSIQFDDLN
jgi:hypothetical protein